MYIGLDLSTQQLKALILYSDMKIHFEVVDFDKDLKHFGTTDGVYIKDGAGTVTAPVLMWIEAIDMLFSKLSSKVDLSQVLAISGSAQQHGSVYLCTGFRDILRNIDGGTSLSVQLKNCLATLEAPVWMDTSTRKECTQLERDLGGPEVLAKITGSRAFERFTGNQIAKMFRENPGINRNTENVCLVSNFLASVFLGNLAAVDASDASGMNLLDINSKDWSDECLEACAVSREKLPPISFGSNILGNVCGYFQEHFGLSSSAKVVSFTGDNPASLLGLRLTAGTLAISLGTSDTLMMWLEHPNPRLHGHVFVNPLSENAYMGLLCYKNGSLAREKICELYAKSDWMKFEEILGTTKPGNDGNVGVYFYSTEILPNCDAQVRRWNIRDEEVEMFSPEVEVRAIVEGQILSKRLHAEALGLVIDSRTRIIATGGASKNKSFLQIISDIFGTPVHVQEVEQSAALGAAFRAKHAINGGQPETFLSVTSGFSDVTCAVNPTPNVHEVYDAMLKRYRRLEKSLRRNC